MRHLNKSATTIFRKLTEDVTDLGEHTRVDTSGGAFMPVAVECVNGGAGGVVFSVSHYWEQNGDLMADPDMTFLASNVDSEVYPLTFRQDGGLAVNTPAATLDDHCQPVRFSQRAQADITAFANQWMRNIRNQQTGLFGKRRAG